MKQLKLGIDIDGCVADFVGTFLNIYNFAYNTSFLRKDITQYDIAKALGEPPERVYSMIFKMQTSGVYDILATIPEARKYLHRLKNDGHKLDYISDRINASGTINWFRDNNIPYDRLFLVKEKLQVFKELGTDLVIEDKPSTVINCASNGIESLLIDAPYNRGVPNINGLITRVTSWEEIYDFIDIK